MLPSRSRNGRLPRPKPSRKNCCPREIPQMPGYGIASAWQSARLVGGDYFDILPLDAKTLGLCIADVAGKGMPAALLMSNLQAAGARTVFALGGAKSPLQPAELHRVRNTESDPLHTFFTPIWRP